MHENVNLPYYEIFALKYEYFRVSFKNNLKEIIINNNDSKRIKYYKFQKIWNEYNVWLAENQYSNIFLLQYKHFQIK